MVLEWTVAALYTGVGLSALWVFATSTRQRVSALSTAIIAWVWIVFFVARAAFDPCCGQQFLGATAGEWSTILHVFNVGFFWYLAGRLRNYR